MTQTIVVRRNTTSAATVPNTLEHGELAANLVADPPKLWIGTPSGVKPLLVGGGVIIASVAPDTANAGDLWWDNTDGRLYVWFEDAWVGITDGAEGGGAGGGITIDDTPPDNPQVGALWISDDQLYVQEESGWIPVVQMARWTIRRISPDGQLYGCAYGNGMFVATGGTTTTVPRAYSSADGINWTERAPPADNTSNGWLWVAHGNNTFVAVSGNTFGTDPRIMSSSDGITWTSRSPPVNNVFTKVRFLNGLFFVFTQTANASPSRVITSPDGINWSPISVPEAYWRDIAYGNGTYVMIAGDGVGRVLTSPDGITWARHAAPDDSWSFVTVAYGAGLFVAMSGNRIMTSPDGINWTIRSPIEYAAATAPQWNDIIYAQNMFVTIAGNTTTGMFNRIAVSRDGINWRIRQAPSDQAWQSITYGKGFFLSVAYNGVNSKIMTSSSP